MKSPMVLFCLLSYIMVQSQNHLPYNEIPDYPDNYTPGSVAARVIDGLGFRYYWATEGLGPEDLKFKPSEEARTTEATLQHIFEMSHNLLNATKKKPSISGEINSNISFQEIRKETLNNLKEASEILKANGNRGLEEFDLVFKGENYEVTYPFWNLLNGPIADCIWHVGQVVTFRRSSGNPFNGNMSVLTGKEKGK